MSEDTTNSTRNINLVLLIATYFVYLFLGGVAFSYLEEKAELKANDDIKKVTNSFLEKHNCMSREEMEEFISFVQSAVEKGLRVKGNSSKNTNWNFGGAILFAASLLTTIGYGDVAPSSTTCRMFCIIYSIIGIPMTATLLSAMVNRWVCCVEALNSFITRQASTFQLEPRIIHVFLTFVVIVIAACVVFIFPAFFIAKLEDWTYFESLYFCFITMTTVGLGDYVPGCSEKWTDSTSRIVYKVCLVFYFIIGLSFVFLILDLSGRVPETAHSLLFSCEPKMDQMKSNMDEKPRTSHCNNDKHDSKEIIRNR